jgi:hypothetical protein
VTSYDLGDGVNLKHLVKDRDGNLTDATVVFTVTKPDGTTITPSVTHVSTGTYEAATFATDQAGGWSYKVTVSGTVVDLAYGAFSVFPGDVAVRPTALTRIQQGSAGTLAAIWLLDETPTDSSTPVTYAVVDATGASVDSGTATHAATGLYTFVLAGQPQLAALTITWSATIGGAAATQTTYAEIVGGFFFSLAEARGSDDTLADTTLYPLADLVAARLAVETECEFICDRAFLPRYDRMVLDGTGTDRLLLRLSDPDRSIADVRTVRSVKMANTVDGTFTAFTAAELAALTVTSDGMLVRTSGAIFTEQRANVVVEVEYGQDRPPADLVLAAKTRFRTLLNYNKSGIPDRASSFTVTDGGTFRLDMPGPGKTGIPTVDAVYGRYSRRPTGTGPTGAAVPASRTLTYLPQRGSMFHGWRRT